MRCDELAGRGAEHDPAHSCADRGVPRLEGQQYDVTAASSQLAQQPRLGRLARPLAALEADEDAGLGIDASAHAHTLRAGTDRAGRRADHPA